MGQCTYTFCRHTSLITYREWQDDSTNFSIYTLWVQTSITPQLYLWLLNKYIYSNNLFVNKKLFKLFISLGCKYKLQFGPRNSSIEVSEQKLGITTLLYVYNKCTAKKSIQERLFSKERRHSERIQVSISVCATFLQRRSSRNIQGQEWQRLFMMAVTIVSHLFILVTCPLKQEVKFYDPFYINWGKCGKISRFNAKIHFQYIYFLWMMSEFVNISSYSTNNHTTSK